MPNLDCNNRTIAVLNGPNLNMLGKREQKLYGSVSLEKIEQLCKDKASDYNYIIDFRQSNYEGKLVEWIQDISCQKKYIGLVINAAAYTHTSIAIFDALQLIEIPIIEVHLSNIYQREKFRHYSYISQLASEVIYGQKEKGYMLAIDKIYQLFNI